MPDLIDLDIEYLNTSGDGVGQWRGLAITVPFTIPGERVRVELRRSFGSLVEILRPSPHRLEPRCAHFGPGAEPRGVPCGGCSWQHIAYPEQLRLKAALVDRLLREAGSDAPRARPTIAGIDPADPWGYRRKVHFVFANDAGARARAAGAHRRTHLVMGHYARGSRDVIPVRECPVHDERGNRIAFDFYDAFHRAGVQAAGGDGNGVLRSIGIRAAAHSPELAATLVVADDGDKRLRTATRATRWTQGAPSSLHLNVHPRDDGFIFGRETRTLSGPARLREAVAGTKFLISPTAFFQTNITAAEQLVRLVLEAIPDDVPVLDLYAGAGLFSIPLARAGHVVTAIEENRAAVADGEASLRVNRLPQGRCRFVAARVEQALGRIDRAEAVVLDPPRDGCAPPVVDDLLGRVRPARVIYVSCNPEVLATDLVLARRHGYRVDSVQPVDMFPHTAHVETVAVLTTTPRRRAARPAV